MKIFLADVNSSILIKENLKTDYFLISFYTHRKTKNVRDVLEIANKDILLDSGAFTFMNDIKRKGKTKNINWDEYIEEYAEFINKYDIKHFFELDIDVLVGLKEVERLRDKLEQLTGKQSIPVWHAYRGIDYWKKMVKYYKYIAIGGLVAADNKYKVTPAILKQLVIFANKHKVKVHGLGFTKKEMWNIPWYSVDSTSWSGIRFGYTKFTYQGGNKMKNENLLGMDKKYYKELFKNNFKEWNKLQKYADKQR